MEKKISILQSNYIPWKGYFEMINMVDEFIIYDDAQYTKNDWRNRNKIKTIQGVQWITIPVYHSLSQKIKDVKISDSKWNKVHWKTIVTNYSKAHFFKETRLLFEDLYLSRKETFLSDINLVFIKAINEYLGINTKILNSSDFELKGDSNERLVYICKQASASIYLSGPAGRNYIDEELFNQEKIKIEWMNYDGYPEYPQLYPPFDPSLSILDLIFNTGTSCHQYFRNSESTI
jgi:hypothetical protein